MRLLRGLALIGLMVTTAATAPVVTVPNVSVMEDAGSAAVNLLKPKSNSYSKVRLYTVDGTAKAGVDYHAVDVTLTLANSVLKVQQLIPILDNSTYQGDRKFTVKLTCVRFCTLAASTAVVTITDNEAAPAVNPCFIFDPATSKQVPLVGSFCPAKSCPGILYPIPYQNPCPVVTVP
jgi:hypothetical protein